MLQGVMGNMPMRSKRAAVCGETVASTPVALSMSPVPSTPSSINGTLVSEKSSAVAIPNRRCINSDKGHLMIWINAMRAQSPPQFRSTDGQAPVTVDKEAVAYSAWLDTHPSALSYFEKIVKLAKSKQIVVFLDYDGTLSPIVSNPDQAIMTHEMRATLKELAECVPTAIISGRARAKVYEFVKLSELYYAGSHGMDIMGPANSSSDSRGDGSPPQDTNGNDVFFQPASEFLPLMDKVCTSLIETTKSIKGARVENNKYCGTVHFRNVSEELWEALAFKIQSILKDYPSLSLTYGRKVLEVRPAIAWDKGKAVNYLLNSLGLADPNDVFPIYIGDDRTDEDAFKLLNGMKPSCGILVTSVPKRSNATFSLRDPSEVREFLNRLVHWIKWGSKTRDVLSGRYFITRPSI